jgi:hypothetical protein
VPADPTKWSAKSQHPISFHYVREYYVPYHPNVATKNMLRKLLEQIADNSPVSRKGQYP